VELVGHKVSINSNIGVGEQSTNEGTLEEAGGDYLVIRPYDYPDWPQDSIEEYDRMGGHWFFIINDVVPIVHARSCLKCKTPSIA
jgi:hypothetical protein